MTRPWLQAHQAGLAAALPILLLTACGPQTETQEVEFRVPVSVQDVETGTVEDTIVTTGTLRAPESVILRVETGGLLSIARNEAGRRLAEGDLVRAGTAIAEVGGEDARIEAGIEAAQRRYEMAVQELESTRREVDLGIRPREAVRLPETQVAEAELALDRSRLADNRTRLVTPISGVILKLARDQRDLPVADGQLVARGFEVAQIAPVSMLIADVDLVGPDLARARTGLEARVRHFAWERKDFSGQLIRLAPALDPVTHTLRAEVEVDNSSRLLLPGMFIEVSLVAERREEVAVVPRQAVTERGGKNVVFVLNSQRVSRRDVVVGLGDDDTVEIRQGLEPGERIVVRGLETLTDGTRVRVTGG